MTTLLRHVARLARRRTLAHPPGGAPVVWSLEADDLAADLAPGWFAPISPGPDD